MSMRLQEILILNTKPMYLCVPDAHLTLISAKSYSITAAFIAVIEQNNKRCLGCCGLLLCSDQYNKIDLE